MAARQLPGAPRALHRLDTVAMDTWVQVQVVSDQPAHLVDAAMRRALTWFMEVERACSRFEPDSEVMRLSRVAGRSVPVSPLLLESVAFALELARGTDGRFDPTVGALLEQRGFAESYRTGATIASGVDQPSSYRDVRVDRARGTITLRRPLILDLGAVVKGLGVDLAVRSLEAAGLHDLSVDAGGDLAVRGRNVQGRPWQIGIQHPRAEGLLVCRVGVSDAAVCTSGDYERRAPDGSAHIVDARSGAVPLAEDAIASLSVIAPTAMAADGLSTAALLLGRGLALPFLEHHGVQGLIVHPDGSTVTTSKGFADLA